MGAGGLMISGGDASPSVSISPTASQVSAQLFCTHRRYHEGQLTKRKELVVANVHLAEAALKARRGGCSAVWLSAVLGHSAVVGLVQVVVGVRGCVCGGVAASCVDDRNLVALCTCDTPLQLGLDRRLRVLPFSVRNWSEPDAVRVSGEGGGRHRGCPKCALPPELCVATCHACPSAEEQQSAGRCDGGEGLACRRYPAAAASIAT